MFFTMGRSDLLSLVNQVSGPALQKTTQPILSSLLVETVGTAGVRISSNSYVLGLSGTAAAKVNKPGAVAVPAKPFKAILRGLPSGVDVVVESADDFAVKIKVKKVAGKGKGGKVNYKVVGLSGDEFPALMAADSAAKVFSLPLGVVRQMISSTAYAVSDDEGRPHVNSALFEVDASVLRMVGTNGHCLSYSERPVDGLDDFSVLISKLLLKELRSLLARGDGADFFELAIGSNGVLAFTVEVSDEPMTLVGKQPSATFPPWTKVIPDKYVGTLKVDRGDLLAAVARAAIVSTSNEKSGEMVILHFGPEGNLLSPDGNLQVSGEDPLLGEGVEDVSVSYDGPSKEVVAVNTAYLTGALSAVQCEEVLLRINGPTAAIVVNGSSDNDPVGVVMPMRL